MLDVLEDFLQLRSIRYARLDGSTIRQRRALDIKLFQRDDSPFQVYLISTRAGGLGINLTKASTVVICDTDWNPQNDLQAIARAHRIGQTKTVKVYRLICRATVEDQMLDRVRRKMFLSVKVMSDNQSDSNTKGEKIGTMEMMKILRNGSSALTSTDDGMSLAQFLEASFDEVVRVSKKREDIQDAIIQRDCVKKEEEGNVSLAEAAETTVLAEIEEAQQRLLSGVAQVKSRLFEGEVIPRTNKDIANEWTALQKRARKDKLVHIGGMAFAPEPITVIATRPVPKKKTKREEHLWEDWCNHCRDGGALVMCSHCPRVFHAACQNITAKELRHALVSCSQHECTMCSAPASVAGLLFRCRTCPQAFCESCLDIHGEVDYVGEILPEFLLLGRPARPNAYFIQCCDCKERLAEDPGERAEWEEQFKRDDAALAKIRAENMGLEVDEPTSATPTRAEDVSGLRKSGPSSTRVKREVLSVATSLHKTTASENRRRYHTIPKKEPKLESLDLVLPRIPMVLVESNSRKS
jgi:SWI/SNF-related matrix-associated actin-dependent regulator of chromatin subfamily A member 5